MAQIKYRFTVTDLSEDKKKAYKAIIPDLDNAVVYGSSWEELEVGVQSAIDFFEREKKISQKVGI